MEIQSDVGESVDASIFSHKSNNPTGYVTVGDFEGVSFELSSIRLLRWLLWYRWNGVSIESDSSLLSNNTSSQR